MTVVLQLQWTTSFSRGRAKLRLTEALCPEARLESWLHNKLILFFRTFSGKRLNAQSRIAILRKEDGGDTTGVFDGRISELRSNPELFRRVVKSAVNGVKYPVKLAVAS